MPTASHDLTITCSGPEGLPAHRNTLLDVYRDVYADRLENSFFTPERFWERLTGYGQRPGFRLVMGQIGNALVGFTLGETLPKDSGWWRGFRGNPPAGLLMETGSRTFAVNELMVRPAWRRNGFAKALSDALLADRTEERATLLVRAENTVASMAYAAWGFSIIGQIQPFADSPVYEAMVRNL